MSDKQNALSLCRQIFHDHHELLDFLRSKYCCRLIKDQDFIITIQHFQDFRSLLHTHGDIFDLCIRVNGKSVLLRQLYYFFSCFVFLKEATFCRSFYSKHNVIQYRKAFYQFKMLMDHTNSKFIGIIRVLDLNFFTVFVDLSFFRLIQSKQNTHQR